ncbi:MATE family efflux transporter [Chloroflexota bacterium]
MVFDRDWTKGSIIRNLLSLSWPMIINEALWSLGFIIDMIWVGKLGSAPIAAVGVAGIIVMVSMTAIFGLSVGARAMIARFVGADDASGANHVTQQAFVINGTIAIIVATTGFFFAEPILGLLGLKADVAAEGTAYLRIQFVGSVAMSFWVITESVMYASGDGINPMKITIAARLVHTVLTPFLVLGWWIFPRMGVSGAAMSNLIAFSAGMGLGLWFLFTRRTRLRLT